MTRSWILFALTLAACSGPDRVSDDVQQERVEDPATETTPAPEPAPEAAAESDAEHTACASDSDCEMYTHCCDCPRVPYALHAQEAEAARQLCMRVRCAACGVPAPDGPPQAARCRDAVCVAETAPDTTSCAADADCEVVTPCCDCPPTPVAMNRASATASREACMRTNCAACDAPIAPTPSRRASCRDAVCVLE